MVVCYLPEIIVVRELNWYSSRRQDLKRLFLETHTYSLKYPRVRLTGNKERGYEFLPTAVTMLSICGLWTGNLLQGVQHKLCKLLYDGRIKSILI